jgi:hypothetical protein
MSSEHRDEALVIVDVQNDLRRERIDAVVEEGREPAGPGYSGFDGTKLEAILRGAGTRRVHVAGLALDYCVLQTALDAPPGLRRRRAPRPHARVRGGGGRRRARARRARGRGRRARAVRRRSGAGTVARAPGRREDVRVLLRDLRILALLAAAAAALALAGCGGGGGASTTTSGPTHAQYVAAANGICSTARKQTASLINEIKSQTAAVITGNPGEAKALAAKVAQLHDVAAANLAKLRALAQPTADHTGISHMLKPLETVVGDIGQAATALSHGAALNAAALFQEAQPVAAQVTSAAHALGADQCGAVLSALA